jgi:hypothetical protein
VNQTQGPRRARAALTSSALVVLTLAAHSAASGTLPSLVPLVLVVGLATALTWAVSDRRRSLAWTTAYLVGAQALLHLILAFAGTHGHAAGLVPSTSMLAAHLAAALVAAVVLVHSDGLIQRWAALLAHLLGSPATVLADPVGVPGRVLPPSTRRHLHVRDALRHSVERRGPPRAVALVT